ncbi:MAG: hypothetical protein FD177_2403 [Desulfovibrionaceae bacterium]|nr:MAG: hypothetical protein FD177_2403 [Desulfovibrionaceae bacterium]
MAKKQAQPQGGQSGTLCYVGPTLTGAVFLAQFTNFKGGQATPAVEARRAADEEFASLFVPMEELGQARRDLADPVSELARASAHVRKTMTRRA